MATTSMMEVAPQLPQTVPVAPSSDRGMDAPDFLPEEYRRRKPLWEKVSHLLGGTRVMREQSDLYNPRNPAESPAAYFRRMRAAEVVGLFRRTLRGLAGMVFRKNPILQDDVPVQLKDLAENIDAAHTHLDRFLYNCFYSLLSYGVGGILVEYPSTPGAEALSSEEEAKLGLRPYWSWYTAPNVLQVLYTTDEASGAQVLSLVVLREMVEERRGLFGRETVTQYRVLQRLAKGSIIGTTYRRSRMVSSAWLVTGRYYVSNQEEIPFVPMVIAPDGGSPTTADPPLLDLADLNIAHWQVLSDHRWSLHMASMPLYVFTGRGEGEEIKLSTSVGIDLPKGADCKIVEHTGAALSATRTELQDIETRAAAQGMSMLQRETRAAETAQAKAIDKSEQDSTLASAARGLQDGAEQALQYTARYLRLPSGGQIRINMEFGALSITALEIQAYSAMVEKGQLSVDTLWDILEERGNILPEDFDPKAEHKRIDAALPEVTIPEDQPLPTPGAA